MRGCLGISNPLFRPIGQMGSGRFHISRSAVSRRGLQAGKHAENLISTLLPHPSDKKNCRVVWEGAGSVIHTIYHICFLTESKGCERNFYMKLTRESPDKELIYKFIYSI